MATKAETDALLGKLPLLRIVDTTDLIDAKTGTPRRGYAYAFPQGGGVYVEIDADPSPEQLADLARHLPLAEKDKAAALEVMTTETAVAADDASPDTKGTP